MSDDTLVSTHLHAGADMPGWHAEMLDGLTHDMRNLLTVIRGNIQLIEHQTLESRSQAAYSLEARIAAINEALGQLEAQVTRIEQRPGARIAMPRDLVELARRCAMMQELPAQPARIQIESAQPELVGMWNDVDLTCILDNLISNALKYSPPDTPVVIRLWAETSDQRNDAVIQVVDQGIGIPEQALDRIFEPRYRAPNVPAEVRGRGMGLANVRRLALAEGGAISVESAPGHGTCFTVRLPIDRYPVLEQSGDDPLAFTRKQHAAKPFLLHTPH